MRSAFVVTLLIVACSFVCVASDSSDASTQGLMLFEINPYNSDEGVSLHNYGSSEINLGDYFLTDNPSKGSSEGVVYFDNSLVIAPNETITFVNKSEGSGFAYRNTTYVNGDGKVTFDDFALNDSGDDVYLFKGKHEQDIKSSTLLDVFIYGSAKVPSDSKWVGDTFKITNGHFAAKKSNDEFSASSWYNYLIGGTNIQFDPNLKFNAEVTPFLFPESGGIPIYETLENAQSSVYLNIYSISSFNTISLLEKLQKDGVQVTLLLEAAPLGLDKPVTDGRLKTLSDAGATIMLIGDKKGDRYSYDHAKYCIVDNKKVIVTSENWTTGNMNGKTVTDPTKGDGNRGWGAIIESDEYVSFMKNVFLNDSDIRYGDVEDFSLITPGLKPISLSYSSPTDEYHTRQYSTTVTPGLSPDCSYDAETYYIDNAKNRVYAENQSITSSYVDLSKESPLKHLSQKASEGVDVRLILSDRVDISLINEINSKSKIKTAQMKDPYLHNKGIVCDDLVILASVNWTHDSFFEDREFVVAIHSSEITEFYALSYQGDFDRNYKGSGLDVSFEDLKDHYDTPGEYAISVTVKQEGSFTYSWNLDGVKKTTDVSRSVFNLTEGNHTISVTVTDSEGNTGGDTCNFSVGSGGGSGDDGFLEKIKPYLAPIAIVLLAIIAAVFKLSSGGNKKKGKSGKKGKKR